VAVPSLNALTAYAETTDRGSPKITLPVGTRNFLTPALSDSQLDSGIALFFRSAKLADEWEQVWTRILLLILYSLPL
jgi:hypothetical protein